MTKKTKPTLTEIRKALACGLIDETHPQVVKHKDAIASYEQRIKLELEIDNLVEKIDDKSSLLVFDMDFLTDFIEDWHMYPGRSFIDQFCQEVIPSIESQLCNEIASEYLCVEYVEAVLLEKIIPAAAKVTGIKPPATVLKDAEQQRKRIETDINVLVKSHTQGLKDILKLAEQIDKLLSQLRDIDDKLGGESIKLGGESIKKRVGKKSAPYR